MSEPNTSYSGRRKPHRPRPRLLRARNPLRKKGHPANGVVEAVPTGHENPESNRPAQVDDHPVAPTSPVALPPAGPKPIPLFERERTTYQEHREELIRDHENEFVVVHGDEIVGVWPTLGEALHAGYDRFGLEPFMVKEILTHEPVLVLVPRVVSCPT